MERRNFIKIGALGTVASVNWLGSCFPASQDKNENYIDILIAGGTPSGIMAAIAAARLGSRVILTEHQKHIGGMSASGLGKSDIENKEAIAGLFKEFTQKVLDFYMEKYGKDSENVKLCKEGYYYEPSVAELIFNQMLSAEKNITVLVHRQLEKAIMNGDKITGAVFKDRATGETQTFEANVFIDATYEGDLFALAGAEYYLGREGRDDFNEEHAGHIFFDYDEKVILEGSTGKGDNRLPAYTYRLCMTDDPGNSFVMSSPPPGYDRNNYIGYFDDLKEGRLSAPKEFKEGHGYYPEHFDTMVRVFSFTKIPNNKYDVNINPRPLGFPFVELNYDYPEANWEEREKISKKLRELTLGLIFFVQNDPEIPVEQRELARGYHLPLDEFTDNGHFPWQLYIREARRLKGQYTLTENDVRLKGDESKNRNTVFYDSIITGEFPIDSFPVPKEPSPDRKVLEGYIGLLDVSPYQVPFRIMVPEKIKGLIVPVAASTSHVAFSTVRMEPLWMGIGQVAGIAANLANNLETEIQNLPINQLQKVLIDNDQILTYFEDIDKNDKAFHTVQFWGTKGFFDSYFARTKDPITPTDLKRWIGKLENLLELKTTTPPLNGKDMVTVSMFIDVISKLALNSGLIKPDDDPEKSLVQYGLSTSSWLYNPDNFSLPLLRGEACIAFYNLFVALQNKSFEI